MFEKPVVRTNSIVTGMHTSDDGDGGGYPYLGSGFDERDMPLEALFALVDKYRCRTCIIAMPKVTDYLAPHLLVQTATCSFFPSLVNDI